MTNTAAQPYGQTARQPYEPPRVEALGTIAQITQALDGNPTDTSADGGSQML